MCVQRSSVNPPRARVALLVGCVRACVYTTATLVYPIFVAKKHRHTHAQQPHFAYAIVTFIRRRRQTRPQQFYSNMGAAYSVGLMGKTHTCPHTQTLICKRFRADALCCRQAWLVCVRNNIWAKIQIVYEMFTDQLLAKLMDRYFVSGSSP